MHEQNKYDTMRFSIVMNGPTDEDVHPMKTLDNTPDENAPATPAFVGHHDDGLDPRVHERRWLILGALCMSLFIIVMDNTILNVAIPSLITDLGASNSEIQWIIDSYVIVFAGLLLTSGSLSDRFGRKGALQAGIVLFGIGSAAAALSNSATQLIFTRAFMGIGGALIMPATLSILTNVFRDPRERGRAIAIWAGVSGLAVAVGPITGGLLLEHFSWSSVFWVNIPIGAAALILGAFVVPKSRDPKQTRLDPFGAVLSIVGLATLLFGIIEGPEKGWSSDIVVASFVIAAIALIGFVRWEQHSAHPMLDMSVFRNPRFSSASSTITLTFFALFGSMFLMTQYWQLVHGYTPLQAGIRLVPHALTMMIVAPLSARFVERLGTKRVVTAGLSLIAIGLLALSTIHATSPVSRGHLVLPRHVGRDGHDDGPRHRVGDGVAAPRQGRRRLGGQRHDPSGRRCARRGDHRHASCRACTPATSPTSVGASGSAPADLEIAESSLGGAQRIAPSLGERSDAFVSAANDGFVDRSASACGSSAAIIVFATVMAWRYLPSHAATSGG